MVTAVFFSQNAGTGTLTTPIPGFVWFDKGGGNRIARYHIPHTSVAAVIAALPATAQLRLYMERGISRETEYQAAAAAYYASPVNGLVVDEVYT